MPEISVVMSVYKEPEEWIRESIDSVLNQTFSDFEFIIVNDNPGGEEQKKILSEYARRDSRIRLIENEENLGLAASLNRGISIASGEYIARMDADDISMPDRFEKQISYLNTNSEISICGTWALRFGNLPRLVYRKYKVPLTPAQVLICSLFASPLLHPTVMGRSYIYKDYMYNDECRKAQDYELWTRMICNGVKIGNIPCYLLKYRVTAKSATAESVASQNAVGEVARERMLQFFNIQVPENQIYKHNEICATGAKHIPISIKEDWLKAIKSQLLVIFPLEEKYINEIVDNYWSLNCISSNTTYSIYFKSTLRYGINFLTVLRYIKSIIR